MGRFYGCFQYQDRQLAKDSGFKWDSDKKGWYIEDTHQDYESFSKKFAPMCLNVKFEDRDEIKLIGGVWNKHSKCWEISAHRQQLLKEEWLDFV